MRVLLINPPWDRLRGVNPDTSFQLGLGYLASALRDNGIDVMIYNAEDVDPDVIKQSRVKSLMDTHDLYLKALKNDDHPVWKEVEKLISDYNPDLLGIYTMTPMIGSTVKIASIFKSLYPGRKVAAGGPHPSLLPDEVLGYPEIDFAVRGEGEVTIVELCNELSKPNPDFKKIDGLSYRENGSILNNSDRQLIKDLDELTFPAKDLLFFPERARHRFIGAMTATRGCPYRCAFCSVQKIWGRGIRYRSPTNVYAEIESLVIKKKQYDFVFWDDSLTVKRKWLFELCDLLIDAPFNIKWGCSTRVDLIDEEMLERMKEAGCGEIGIGIESGSESMLKRIKKDMKLEDALKASDLLNKKKFSWAAFFMVGFPEEEIEDIQATFSLMKRIKPSNIIFSIYAPFPGNEFYEEMKVKNLLPEKIDWNTFYKHSPENYLLDTIPRDEFLEIVKDISDFVDKYNNSFITQFKRVKYRLPLLFKRGNLYLLRSSFNFIKRKMGFEG